MGLQVVSKEGFGAAYARGLAANWSMESKWCDRGLAHHLLRVLLLGSKFTLLDVLKL